VSPGAGVVSTEPGKGGGGGTSPEVRPNAPQHDEIAAVSVRKERRKKEVEREVAEPRGKVCSTLAALPEIEIAERERVCIRNGPGIEIRVRNERKTV